MPYDLDAPGIHCRGVAEHLEGQPEISRLTVQVWPIPTEIVLELNSFIGAAVHSYLEKRGYASAEVTDLTARGLPQ